MAAKLLEGLDAWEVPAHDLCVEEMIGEGAESEVFAGSWQGCRVAVKQLKGDFRRMSRHGQESLCRELAILGSLRHENIVGFLGVVPYQPVRILMDICEGGTCYDLLHEAPEVHLRWSQKVKMCMDTASAMTYLHSFDPPIVHRDLKSLNLLLESPVRSSQDMPVVKLSDFGRSRPNCGETRMTKSVGTCHWMAPEVYQSDNYNEKVDVYSFGMFVYEVVSRSIPFEDLDEVQLSRSVCRGERPSLEVTPGDCPEMLKTLVKLCWHQDRECRPDFERVGKFLRMIRQEVKSMEQAGAALPQRRCSTRWQNAIPAMAVTAV